MRLIVNVQQAHLLLLVLSCLQTEATKPTVVVTSSQFVAALDNEDVATILLGEDVAIAQADWPSSLIAISRNLTITSQGPHRLLDVDGAKDRALIMPGVQLTLERIVIRGTALGMYFHFLAASPQAFLRLRDGAFLAPVCPQLSRYMDILEAHPRPEQFPGPQRGVMNWVPYCFQRKCYPNHFVMVSMAWDRPLISIAKVYQHQVSFTGEAKRWTWACRTSYTINCINERGYDYCRIEAYEKLRQGKEETIDQQYVITGGVCIGVTALTLVGGLLYMYWSRREPTAPPHDAIPSCTDIVKIESKLGSGSFGSVYKAIWKGGREVAVKVIKYDAADSEGIAREIATSVRLQHPNVVRTLHHLTMPVASGGDSNAHRGSPRVSPDASKNGVKTDGKSMSWIIQELCDLGSLASHLRPVPGHSGPQGGVLISEASKLQYARDIACGMMYLHKLGICHGDLKPANVLLAREPTDSTQVAVKVADFGLSRMLEEDRSYLNTKATGTITHMAPEFLMSGKLRKACDVYSYGCTLFELVSGEPLYPGMNVVQIIKQVSQGARPTIPPHMSPAWVSLVTDCWAQDDTTRPTFTLLHARLQGMIQQHESSVASAPSGQAARDVSLARRVPAM